MKIQGNMLENSGARNVRFSDAHMAGIARQNGKKSRALRAVALKGQASKKKRRMMACYS